MIVTVVLSIAGAVPITRFADAKIILGRIYGLLCRISSGVFIGRSRRYFLGFASSGRVGGKGLIALGRIQTIMTLRIIAVRGPLSICANRRTGVHAFKSFASVGVASFLLFALLL